LPPPDLPWTPFGPGDNAAPDIAQIQRQASKARAAIQAAQVELTRLAHGPGPDGTPPQVVEVSRADGLWPYLVIRSYPGDIGSRPFDAAAAYAVDLAQFYSPDILVVPAAPPTSPNEVDRAGMNALSDRQEFRLRSGLDYDIWVHVWNLGRTPALGVRLRVFVNPLGQFVAGRQLDLGDRLSETSHRCVRVGTYHAAPGAGGARDETFLAIAECLSDVATVDGNYAIDRHVATTRVTVFDQL
jgi:hypothetical protein